MYKSPGILPSMIFFSLSSLIYASFVNLLIGLLRIGYSDIKCTFFSTGLKSPAESPLCGLEGGGSCAGKAGGEKGWIMLTHLNFRKYFKNRL
jgi:hypothetical protein